MQEAVHELSQERQSGGTVDWPFMLCTLNIMLQSRLQEFSLQI